ncbi:predicted protein [Paecilomyces variotii No. 5]|uniref:BTB domain-containing protein n=1 Tax=Byssochlamys spectabilis (strain No. 5 / NBRC 109023) TaxID=1356009 RepID=V5GDR4_BYSSN|nr:predicted protein [Paecilomyces variotii No. 5]
MLRQALRGTQLVTYEMALETPDREGDVILAAGGNSMSPRRFLISSKVLSLASPVFAALFGPQFLEGSRMAEHGPITILLDEDDAKTMEIMLRILHHQTPSKIENLTTKEMATLAILSDKYDCAGVIRPWTSKWFFRHENMPNLEDYGLILTAAHFFTRLR